MVSIEQLYYEREVAPIKKEIQRIEELIKVKNINNIRSIVVEYADYELDLKPLDFCESIAQYFKERSFLVELSTSYVYQRLRINW